MAECAVKGCQRVPGGSWPLCSKHDGMKVDLDFAQRGEVDDIMHALREAERERTETPLGGTEERTEDVGAPRSKREGFGVAGGTADPRPHTPEHSVRVRNIDGVFRAHCSCRWRSELVSDTSTAWSMAQDHVVTSMERAQIHSEAVIHSASESGYGTSMHWPYCRDGRCSGCLPPSPEVTFPTCPKCGWGIWPSGHSCPAEAACPDCAMPMTGYRVEAITFTGIEVRRFAVPCGHRLPPAWQPPDAWEVSDGR